jgi:hypothetical protein
MHTFSVIQFTIQVYYILNNLTLIWLCAKCLKATFKYLGFKAIEKKCALAADCYEKSYTLMGSGFLINCCDGDGCNNFPVQSANKLIIIFLQIFVIRFLRSLCWRHFYNKTYLLIIIIMNG